MNKSVIIHRYHILFVTSPPSPNNSPSPHIPAWKFALFKKKIKKKYYYAQVSQANWCNMTFTAGNLFPSHSCIGWPESSPHQDLNPGPQIERRMTYQLSYPSPLPLKLTNFCCWCECIRCWCHHWCISTTRGCVCGKYWWYLCFRRRLLLLICFVTIVPILWSNKITLFHEHCTF